MKMTFRKQYSAAYQVFEATVEDCAKEQLQAVMNKMDTMAVSELGKMVAIKNKLENNSTPITTAPTQPYQATTVATPAYQAPTTGYNNPVNGSAPSAKQLGFLKQYNVEFNPETITKSEASSLLEVAFAEANKGKPAKKAYNKAPVTNDINDDDLPF